jgi:hypothetical protein
MTFVCCLGTACKDYLKEFHREVGKKSWHWWYGFWFILLVVNSRENRQLSLHFWNITYPPTAPSLRDGRNCKRCVAVRAWGNDC